MSVIGGIFTGGAVGVLGGVALSALTGMDATDLLVNEETLGHGIAGLDALADASIETKGVEVIPSLYSLIAEKGSESLADVSEALSGVEGSTVGDVIEAAKDSNLLTQEQANDLLAQLGGSHSSDMVNQLIASGQVAGVEAPAALDLSNHVQVGMANGQYVLVNPAEFEVTDAMKEALADNPGSKEMLAALERMDTVGANIVEHAGRAGEEGLSMTTSGAIGGAGGAMLGGAYSLATEPEKATFADRVGGSRGQSADWASSVTMPSGGGLNRS